MNRPLFLALTAAILLVNCIAQSGDQTSPSGAPVYQSIPSWTVNFSDPKLDSPLNLPLPITNGPPTCSADGTAFFVFLGHPPAFDQRAIYSVSAKGKVTVFSAEKIPGLQRVEIRSVNPGITSLVMLIGAARSDETAPPGQIIRNGPFLVRFNYDGSVQGFAPLDVGFRPGQAVQLNDKSFLIFGAEPASAAPQAVIVDLDGAILRQPDAYGMIPPEQDLLRMVAAADRTGMQSSLPLELRLSAVINSLQFEHSGRSLLLLEPGGDAKVLALLPSRDVRPIAIRLPKGDQADSLIAVNGKWIVRAYPEGANDKMSLFEVDPETGNATREIRTQGVPPSAIACGSKEGFYGLRWIDKKPYVITSNSN